MIVEDLNQKLMVWYFFPISVEIKLAIMVNFKYNRNGMLFKHIEWDAQIDHAGFSNELKRTFRSKMFLLGFLSKSFDKFRDLLHQIWASMTFRSQDMTI